MNQLVRAKEVPVWTWTVRWFVPEQTEEVYVNVLPTGEVVGFDHILPEDAPGAAVTPAEAQQIAERFLQAEQGIALGDWTLYDVSATTRPQRTDHSLIWVKQGLDLGEGDLRIWVAVQGDRVGRFGTWVRVPEAFSRDFTQERSRAWLLDDIATGLSMLFLAGGVLVVLWGLYVGLKIGWAPVLAGAAAGLVDLLDSLNRLSLLGSGYDTAVDWQTYVLNTLANYLVSAAESAFLVAFLVVAAQWLLRAVWPRQDKLIPAPPRRGATFARSAWRGMMVGGLELAYLILFYTLAKGLGAWSPVRTPDVDLLATPLPFLAAVYIGLLPALTEELIFRGLGIGLMMRLTRGRTFLALLVPSVLWGFAHSSYLTDPIWLRGVELTISSLLLSDDDHRSPLYLQRRAHCHRPDPLRQPGLCHHRAFGPPAGAGSRPDRPAPAAVGPPPGGAWGGQHRGRRRRGLGAGAGLARSPGRGRTLAAAPGLPPLRKRRAARPGPRPGCRRRPGEQVWPGRRHPGPGALPQPVLWHGALQIAAGVVSRPGRGPGPGAGADGQRRRCHLLDGTGVPALCPVVVAGAGCKALRRMPGTANPRTWVAGSRLACAPSYHLNHTGSMSTISGRLLRLRRLVPWSFTTSMTQIWRVASFSLLARLE
jgi:membrane protease YdiL (CAAX protease family)